MDHSSNGIFLALLGVAWLIGAALPFVLGAGLILAIVWLTLLTAVGLMVAILVQAGAPRGR